ncbi:helix-turn-helix transcriptional regulator [Marinococcus sp. PL1-022]|uniref:helix-turn-helix transcriptional regulator n=1 Tax=Marinococcus sp. PL1-022 TaxID=3095363 RepID=UPI0029C2ED7C|nr:helix-turn-helix transcriptional regulator [Marinococcus sp. PL1-022]MDX6153188.1 helix-turn-helix transcriptional regulator [Marinococcus sp. PL1-022]
MNELGELSNQLSVFRAKKGYSQAEVAKRIGVSRQTIISLEKNKYSPSLKLAFELAHLFDTGIEDIFQYNLKGED